MAVTVLEPAGLGGRMDAALSALASAVREGGWSMWAELLLMDPDGDLHHVKQVGDGWYETRSAEGGRDAGSDG